ncbi:MAG TPA: HEPN domain-containing protein [Longimicrobium sp.]
MLDELEAAHAVVGGARRARAFARQQINQAYVVLLASQFQRFCRDLYNESADHLTNQPAHGPLNLILRNLLTTGNKLDRGNANVGNIGSDFEKLGVEFWDTVRNRARTNPDRQRKLDEMNNWRNAVAHQDFTRVGDGKKETVTITQVRAWRSACNALAVEFDEVMRVYLQSVFGVRPW